MVNQGGNSVVGETFKISAMSFDSRGNSLQEEIFNPISLSSTCVELPTVHSHPRLDERLPQAQEVFYESHAGAGPGSPPEENDKTCNKNPSVMSWGYVKVTARHIKRSMRLFIERTKRMSAKRIILTIIFIIMLMAGNVMQILMLNFWLVSFPADGAAGNYTAFALPGIVYSVFFLVIFIVYAVMKKPNLRFAKNFYGSKIIFLIGFYDTFNSWLATYAASYTSEMLQSLFLNLGPLYALFFLKWILHDPRQYLNIWIIIMFIFTITGILIVLCFNLLEGSTETRNKRWFTLIYFSSIPLRVLMNVYQSLYMIVYTYDSSFVEWLYWRLRGGEGGGTKGAAAAKPNSTPNTPFSTLSPGSPAEVARKEGYLAPKSREFALLDDAENGAHLMIPCDCRRRPSEPAGPSLREGSGGPPSLPSEGLQERQREIVSTLYHQGEDTAVKLVMLAGETFVQMTLTLALLPADAIPWFGRSATVQDTWTNFESGIRSFFTIPMNFLYGFLYTLGFVFNYIGAAYLNHHSVTLCLLITQLSSPLTGLLLAIAPSLNALDAENTLWGRDLIAILMLTFAALVYVVWEELTREEMEEGERALKMSKLQVRHIEINDIFSEEEPEPRHLDERCD